MARLLGQIPGIAADYSGAISVLKQMGACVVLCGPQDCLSNYSGMEETAARLQRGPIEATGTTEVEAVLGMEESLVARASRLAQDAGPLFVALVGTPVSALVGADLAGAARRVEAESGIPAIAIDTTGFDLYPVGVEKAYDALSARWLGEDSVRKAGPRPDQGTVNLLGYTHLDYCDDADLDCLLGVLERRGERPAGIVGYDGIDDFSRLLRAERSLVLSSGALPLARRLERVAGIPWSCELPIGGDGPLGQAPDSGGLRVLVVGDQVLSHAIRLFVERRHGARCDVACAVRLHAEIMREGDACVKDEQALARKAARGYDVVVADPLCASVVRDDQAFIGLPRPAMSSLVHQRNHVGFFDAEIAHDLDRALSRA